MEPKFQETFLPTILPVLIAKLKEESIPRVTSEILSALTDFIEGTLKGLTPYV